MSPVAAADAAVALTDSLCSNLTQTEDDRIFGAEELSCTFDMACTYGDRHLTTGVTQCRVVSAVDDDGMQARLDFVESSQPGSSEILVQHLRRN